VAGVVVSVLGFQTGIGWLVAGLLLTGAGLGAAMSVASTAIIGNAPASRAGMASSVEEVSYEFGNLTAVALMGSLVTFVYAAAVQLPPGAPDAAGRSLADALASAGGDDAVVAAAHAAFDTGYLVVMVVVAAVLACGAALTWRLLRHHGPGTSSSAYADH
jgi:DHA2 family multidrug resistance protein-like MFS transporter